MNLYNSNTTLQIRHYPPPTRTSCYMYAVQIHYCILRLRGNLFKMTIVEQNDSKHEHTCPLV